MEDFIYYRYGNDSTGKAFSALLNSKDWLLIDQWLRKNQGVIEDDEEYTYDQFSRLALSVLPEDRKATLDLQEVDWLDIAQTWNSVLDW